MEFPWHFLKYTKNIYIANGQMYFAGCVNTPEKMFIN